MNFENINCNFCRSNRHKKIANCKIEEQDCSLPIGAMSIVRCKKCGLTFVNPRPQYSKVDLDKLYSQDYFDAPYMKFYIDQGGKQSNEPFDFRLDWIERYK